MVKEFEVKVGVFSVSVWTVTKLDEYHFSAIVDGEPYHYKIVNDAKLGGSVKKEAFGRASVEVHYHAKNAGNVVRFQPVNNTRAKRKKEISKDQRGMF